MTDQELLILSFFDKEIPRQMTSKDLTSEMIDAGIGLDASSAFPYQIIVHELKNVGLLNRYKDPSKPQKGASRAVGPELFVLSIKAAEILHRDKQKKEHEAYVTELEFKKLRHEYDLLANQLLDYDETKRFAKKAYWVSIWSVVAAIVSAIAAVIQSAK
jgi:hypothetical protein